MYYRPNYQAARVLAQDVFPLVRERVPEAVCHLAGKTDNQEISELNHPERGVYMHGFVDDIRSYFERAQVLVVPLAVGSGTRIKILEGMASGTPVVSTSIGAEGLECTDGENILIADNATGLATAVVRLLRDREECFRIGAAGRVLVEGQYSWDASAEVVRAEILRVLNEPREA
jgi:glycosyltransferase involved in cell wall biosynthesis